MMFSKKVILFMLMVLVGFQNAIAHEPEKGRVTAAVGPWFYQVLPQFNLPAQDLSSLGVALSVTADVDSNGGVELGLGYANRKYYRKLGSAIIGEQAKKFFVMVGYRHWFHKRFSGALLLHSVYSMGEPDVIFQNSGTHFETAASKAAYNGLDLSFQYDHPLQSHKFLILDVRYSHSFGFEDGETPAAVSVLLAYKQNVDVD